VQRGLSGERGCKQRRHGGGGAAAAARRRSAATTAPRKPPPALRRPVPFAPPARALSAAAASAAHGGLQAASSWSVRGWSSAVGCDGQGPSKGQGGDGRGARQGKGQIRTSLRQRTSRRCLRRRYLENGLTGKRFINSCWQGKKGDGKKDASAASAKQEKSFTHQTCRHILVQKQSEALRISEEIHNGKISFNEAAFQFSEDKAGAHGLLGDKAQNEVREPATRGRGAVARSLLVFV
jgi:hypothetical protein